MIEGILGVLAIILGLCWAQKKARQDVEEASAKLQEEMGEAYNPAAAPDPERSGWVFVLLLIIGTLGFLTLLSPILSRGLPST